MKKKRSRASNAVAPLVGWLFADLLLALAMIFLVANASGLVLAKVPTPVPSPTPTLPPPPCLESHSYFIQLNNIDYQGLIKGDATSIKNVTNQIRNPVDPDGHSLPDISNRRSGLTLIYVGAPNNVTDTINLQVFAHIESITQNLGQQGYLFQRTAYHGMLLLTGSPYSIVQIEIYLFGLNGICPSPTPLKISKQDVAAASNNNRP